MKKYRFWQTGVPVNEISSLHQYIRDEFMEDGAAVIHVRLYEGLELYNQLSYGNQIALNPEIINYIDSQSAIIPTHIPLIIRFHGKKLTAQEQENIRQCLTEHYSVVLHDKKWDSRINHRKIIGLTLFGLAILSVYIGSSISENISLRTEILSIIASFSLWEAVDLFLLERLEIRKAVLNAAQQFEQKIEFEEI